MAIQAHIRELSDKHSRLEQMIQKEMKSPSSDSVQIKALKLKKMKIKEELEALKIRN